MVQAMDTDAGRWIIASSETELTGALPVGATLPVDATAADGHVGNFSFSCFGVARDLLSNDQPIAVLVSERKVLEFQAPATGQVNDWWREGDGPLRFTIVGSPRVFTLEGSLLDKANVVVDAFDSAAPLLVLAPGFDARPLVVTPWASVVERPCREYQLDEASMHPVSQVEASSLYDRIFLQDSTRPYTQGIPFRLAQEYCEAKAEAIARFLLDEGVDCGKAWMVGSSEHALQVRTTSSSSCRVEWGHHVAVIARSESAAEGFLVFDPTMMLEGGVISLSVWDSKFSSEHRRLRLTTADAYYQYRSCYQPSRGPGENRTDLMLARCRLAQYARQCGHPPFPCAAEPMPT